MIGDKLVISLVVTDTGAEWSAMGSIEVDTPSRRIDETAFLCATWWAIEALGPRDVEGGDRKREHSHRTTERKASSRR